MNKADEERMRRIHEMPCIACSKIEPGLRCGRVEAHHLVDKGNRQASGGHQATIPLGAYHHRGEPAMGFGVKWMREKYGPSFALEKKAFIERFGTERELLAETNKLIKRNAAASAN